MATTAERLAQYEDLFAKSQQYDPTAFQKDFKKAYGEATDYNQDLIAQQAKAMGELQAVAPNLRQEMNTGLMVDPIAQRALIAQARQMPIQSYSTAANLLGQRGQKYSDILSSALGAYQTDAQKAQSAMENAWMLYQDALERSRYNTGDTVGFDYRDLIDTDGDGIPDWKDETPYGVGGGNGDGGKGTQAGPNALDRTYNKLSVSDISKPTTIASLLNPFRFGRGATVLGNYLGNKNQSDMSFVDKLLNRKRTGQGSF